MRKRRKSIVCIGIIGILLILSEIPWRKPVIREYTIKTGKVHSEINVMVLTDLHSSQYGDGQSELIQKIQKCSPDVILLVGDIVDEPSPYSKAAMIFSAIAKKYPCYYVIGNHEFWSGNSSDIESVIESYGIIVLHGNSELLQINGEKIRICGVDDPSVYWNAQDAQYVVSDQWMEQFTNCEKECVDGRYSILLSHRPELVDLYRDSKFDLVVSGHAHGGQVRIPGILNGLFAPNQGIFPKYAGGQYQLGSTTMIVSRGLCKNIIPRIFNSPEVVMVHLEPKD